MLLLRGDKVVSSPGIDGQQHPVCSYGVVVQLVLLTWHVNTLYYGAAVGHAGGDAHQNGQTNTLRIFEGNTHHVVGLLLVGWLEGGNHGKLTIET